MLINYQRLYEGNKNTTVERTVEVMSKKNSLKKNRMIRSAAAVTAAFFCIGSMPAYAVQAAELAVLVDDAVASNDTALSFKRYSEEELLYNYMLQSSGVTPMPDNTRNGAAAPQ